MTCDEVEQRGVAEEYLLGRLSEPDQVAFEQHYFECETCYARLGALRAVQDALAAGAAAAPARRQAPARAWMALAAAVLVVIGGAAATWRAISQQDEGAGSSPPPTGRPMAESTRIPADVIRMAKVTAPPYAPRRLRSGEQREDFEAAMQSYQSGDYPAAARGLETVLERRPADEEVRFYLGASQALSSRWRDAIASLEPLTSRRESAYAEEAAFITARVHVQLGDARAAIAALDSTMAFAGDREADARALRAKLATLPVR